MSRFMKIRQYNFLEFEPRLFRLGLVPTEFPHEAKPVGYHNVVQTFGVSQKLQAALNGPMAAWSRSDKWKGVQNYDKTESMFLQAAYYQKDQGVDLSPRYKGMTVGVSQQTNPDGSVSVVSYSNPGWVKDENTLVAVQLPFALVVAGKPVSALGNGNLSERTHRPALGVLKNGNMVMGGGYGSCMELANALVDAGVRRAGYLDGGGSYHFLVAHHTEHKTGDVPEDPTVPSKNDFYGPSKDRPTPSWILALSESDDQVLV